MLFRARREGGGRESGERALSKGGGLKGGGLKGGGREGGDGEDVAFVDVLFGVKRHIIIFKEEIGEVVVDAATCEFDDGFFLRPEAGEGDLGVGSGGDEGEFLGGEDIAGEGLAVTTDALDVDANGTGGNDTGEGGTTVGEVEMESPSYPPKGGRGRRGRRQSGETALREREFGFAVGAEGEGGLLGDAIDFAEGLAKEEVGEGAFETALPMLEAEGFFASPRRKGGDGCFQLFRGDGIKIV